VKDIDNSGVKNKNDEKIENEGNEDEIIIINRKKRKDGEKKEGK